ncbi:MAG: iron-sulfur cluster assembly protein, partial [Actinomycetota bacterium]|nr:iron-sulfur cluster assembly protein [Actinomycetota bacterium]
MAIPTPEEISAILGQIQDPQLHRGMNELRMIRSVDVDGINIRIVVALMIEGSRLGDYYLEVIPAKLRDRWPELGAVDVELTTMTEAEREAVVANVRKETPAPFGDEDSRTNVIAVGSGKGGVGKSTTTVN